MQRVVFLALISLLLAAAGLHVPAQASLPAGTIIQLYADSINSDGTPAGDPATLNLTVVQSATVNITATSPTQTTIPGQDTYVPVRVTNAGNGSDTINLSAKSANGWSLSFVRDDNSDGIHQATEVAAVTNTGILAMNASYLCFVKVSVPSNAASGDTLTITATSSFDPAQGTAMAIVSVPAPANHTISFTSGPVVNPASVASGTSVQCSAAATDSSGHTVTYSWSDGGAGGAFSPSASAQNPSYQPVSNTSGSNVTVTLTCTASCSQNSTISKSASTTLTVSSASSGPKIISVSPRDSLTSVKLDDSIIITFDRAMDKMSTQSALQFEPALDTPAYSWSTDGTVLTITHKQMQSAVLYSAAVMSTAKDMTGAPLPEYHWNFTTVGGARFDPAEMYVKPNVNIITPHIMWSDPSNPTKVTMFVTLPDDAIVNTASSYGNLTCVQKGSGASSITSTWNSAEHEIAITATIATPGPSVEVVKSVTFAVPSGPADELVKLNAASGLTLHVASSTPGDFNRDAAFNSDDMPLFDTEWARWHASSVPAYKPSIDWVYDIYPHSAGTWPNWTCTGDAKINIDDATAYTECYIASRSTSRPINSQYGTYISTTYSGYKMLVRVTRAQYGMYRANITLPYGVRFNSSIAPNGNLVNVVKQGGAGNLFYTEYDAAKRTVKITGTVTGYAPYLVAAINFY